MKLLGLGDGARSDLPFIVGFTLFFTVPFAIYLVQLARGTMKLPKAKPRSGGGAGKRLCGPLLIGYYYWLVRPMFRFASRTSLTPNQLTLGALVGALASAVAIATGHFALASGLVIGGATLDLMDGELARTKGLQTPGGAFLDSTLDRISDGFIFGGCVVYYAGTPIMYVALAALVMSFTVSYTRSRAEALGAGGPEGLMQRAERIVVLGVALAFSPVVAHHLEGFVSHPFYGVTAAALCIIAALNTLTAVARIIWTMRRLEEASTKSELRPLLGTSPANLGAGGALGVPSVLRQTEQPLH